MSYKIHSRCRACGFGPSIGPGGIKSSDAYDRLVSVLDLGVMPLPNAFKKTGESLPGYYPIELLVCPNCTLGQLSAVVDPKVLYDNYPYVTSTSLMMLNHFEALWEFLNSQRKIESVIEIGSNDGLCLEHFKTLGAGTVLGIDPAENLVKKSIERGVYSMCSLFDRQSANMASSSIPSPDLILARHVFCHIEDWQNFIHNVLVMMSKETVVCIEVPYAHDTIKHCEWDQVYAEHLSFLTIKSMRYLLEGTPLRIHNIKRFPVHGGAIAIIIRRSDSESERSSSVDEFVREEKCSIDDWKKFGEKARDQITNLRITVSRLRAEGKRVVGYGASAKSTVWNSACKFTRKDIEFIADCTPQKQWTMSPGTNIPIVDEGALTRELPDYAICYAWNFAQEIMAKENKFREAGGKWILPVPEVKIV